MSSGMNKLAKNLQRVISETDKKKPKPYDTLAEVLKVDGKTVWVKIPGGVNGTPVEKTINAKPGDTVRVRVSGGRAWVIGNNTAPPTDDKEAHKAQEQVRQTNVKVGKVENQVEKVDEKVDTVDEKVDGVATIANNTAQYFWFESSAENDPGAHISETSREEWDDPQNPKYHSGGNLLARSNGVAIRESLNELATFGASLVELGKNSMNAIIELCDGIGIISAYRQGLDDVYRMKLQGSDGVDVINPYFDGVPNYSMNLIAAEPYYSDTALASSYADISWNCSIVQETALVSRFAHDVIGTGFMDPYIPHSDPPTVSFDAITCTRGGRILACARIEAESMTDQDILNLRLVKVSGGTVTTLCRASNRASGNRASVIIASKIIEVDSGDELKWQTCNSSGARGILKNNDGRSYFTLQYVTGPAPRFV